MDYSEFIGEVQHRIEVGDQAHAVRTTRAVLVTLGERIQAGEAGDLAAPLPMEIDRYLLEAESGQRFDWDEFVRRVWEREGMSDPDDRADAAYHARVVMDVVSETVPPSEMQQVRNGLPADEDWDELFEVADQEASGE